MKIKNKIEITGMIETPLSEEEFHKKFIDFLIKENSNFLGFTKEMEERKELIKALKVIKQTCKSVTGKQCDDMYESGNCPIYEILGSCTLEDIPEDWYIGEKHE